MVLLDFVGDRRLTIHYEETRARGCGGSCAARPASRRRARGFPPGTRARFPTTTFRSSTAGVPSIDLIDFDFPCWHRRCDDMSAVSERSVNAVGETIYELLKTL